MATMFKGPRGASYLNARPPGRIFNSYCTGSFGLFSRAYALWFTLIWLLCRERERAGTLNAFNHGSAALSKALGDSSLMASIRADTRRKRGSIWAEEKKKEVKEKKIKKIQEEEDKKEAEGETYGAGIAPV